MQNDNEMSIKITAGLADRLLWFFASSPGFIAFLYNLFSDQNLKGIIFGLAMFTFPQIWLAGFKIELAKEVLSYRELFRRRKSINLTEVTKAKVKVGIDKKEPAGTPTAMFRLMLYDSDRYKRIPFVINIKPFHQDDLAKVAQAIVRYAPNAKIDKTVQAMANRDIRSIAREGTGKFLQMAIVIFITFLVLGLIGSIVRWIF